MAMDIGSTKGGPKADINVTPLVDVMLVLLIIMMLVAPMIQSGVDVRLPLADHTVDKPETQEQTMLSIDRQNQFYVNGVQVPRGQMATAVKDVLERKNERVVLIKGDTEASYSAVMAAMDDLRKVGVEDIGLITDPKTPPEQMPRGGK